MCGSTLSIRIVTAGVFIAIGLCVRTGLAEDWPRWRGPRGDGSWRGPVLPEKWPDAGLKPQWKMAVGGGYSGVTVVRSRAFVMDHLKESKPADGAVAQPEVERVLCVSADSGEVVWSHEYSVKYDNLDYGNGPRAAPTFHDGRIYTVGALGDVRCLNESTGEKIWSVNYVADLKGRLPTWGFAGSAFIDSDRVILQPGGDNGSSVVALDRLTGEKIWSSLDDEAGYATPLIAEHAGHRQLILWTPSHIRSVDPLSGQPNWAVPYKVTYGVAIAQPIFEQGHVLVCGYWEGSKSIRLGQKSSDATLAWEENKFLRGLMSQPLYRDGHVYLLDKQYGLTCFDLLTSKKLWDDDNSMTPRGRNPHASLVWLERPKAGGQYERTDRAIILNSEGDLILARLNPTGYHEQARSNIIGPTWAHPAFAGNHVFARGDTELVCVKITGN